MLKACCDCLAAGVREENEVYGARLNGTSWNTPLMWPVSKKDTEKMYLLPKELSSGDRINVTCTTSNNPQWINISLVTGNSEPDYNNVASQLELHFPSYGSSDEKTVMKTIVNGANREFLTDMKPSELIPGTSNSAFTVEITVIEENNTYEVLFGIGQTHIDSISLKHHIGTIKYIIIDGDVIKVNRLHFEFA